MRALFILRGCPGSGKTSLLAEAGLEHLAVGFDTFRELFSPAVPCIDEDGQVSRTLRLLPSEQSEVVSATFAALRTRLRAGSTVFFDATSPKISDQLKLSTLAADYGYRTWVVDVQGDLGFEEIAARNARRAPQDRIDPARLHEMWEQGARRDWFAPGLPVITPAQLPALLAELSQPPRVDADRVAVVGDVHSCSQPLDRALAELDTPETHWVFVGDLFDRGPDPVGVWNTVQDLCGQGRATVLTGNHELNLARVNSSDSPAALGKTRDTRDELSAAGIPAPEQREFVATTHPAVLVGADRPWLVTHGGVDQETGALIVAGRMAEVADATCVYGTGRRGVTYNGKSDYHLDGLSLAGRQMHGHRDGAAYGSREGAVSVTRPGHDGEPVICLESGVAAGGHLRVVLLEMDEQGTATAAPVVYEFEDGIDPATVSRPTRETAADTGPGLMEQMQASELVRIREVEDFPGVLSANFTREAFRKGAWDELTVHARGLFFDAETGAVLARGYEKFFHLDQAPGRTRAGWTDPEVTAYPVNAVKKYNGFLGLVASVQGRLAVFTKAGVTDYSRAAKALLEELLGGERCEQLRDMLERTNSTAAFEVVLPQDPHPITEPLGRGLVLLDVIANDVRFSTNDKLAEGISRRFGLPQAERVGVARNSDEFDTLVAAAQDRDDEGVILVDAVGYRGKVKARIYSERKAARGALARAFPGNGESTAAGLGPRHVALEDRLRRSGLWAELQRGGFTVVNVSGRPELDLAALFDELDRRCG